MWSSYLLATFQLPSLPLPGHFTVANFTDPAKKWLPNLLLPNFPVVKFSVAHFAVAEFTTNRFAY